MPENKTQLQNREYSKRQRAVSNYIKEISRLNSIDKTLRQQHHRNYRIYLIRKVERLAKILGTVTDKDVLFLDYY